MVCYQALSDTSELEIEREALIKQNQLLENDSAAMPRVLSMAAEREAALRQKIQEKDSLLEGILTENTALAQQAATRELELTKAVKSGPQSNVEQSVCSQ